MNIGIVADGNGRWAEQKGLSRAAGHQAGADNVEEVVSYLNGKTDYLILYGFSTENWSRPKEEVDGLFRIMKDNVDGKLLVRCMREGIRLYRFGRRDRLSSDFLKAIDYAIAFTSMNKSMQVGFCLDYGAKDEIVSAALRYSGGDFSSYLATYPFPDVDLIIRTGGEHRLSNFLLYQSAYAEIYFTDTLFPDLGEEELKSILDWFSLRTRTFGS